MNHRIVVHLTILAVSVGLSASACGDLEPKGDPIPNATTNAGTNNGGFPNTGTNSGNVGTNNITQNNVSENNPINNVVNNAGNSGNQCVPTPGQPEQLIGFATEHEFSFGVVVEVRTESMAIVTEGEVVADFFSPDFDLTQMFSEGEEVEFETFSDIRSGLSDRQQYVSGPNGTVELIMLMGDSRESELRLQGNLPWTGTNVSFDSIVDSRTCFEATECGNQTQTTNEHRVSVAGELLEPGQRQSIGSGEALVIAASSVVLDEVVNGDCVAEGSAFGTLTVMATETFQ